MGANEKHAATYHGRGYTPTTAVVHSIYMTAWNSTVDPVDQQEVQDKARDEFTRWLETVRAEAKAEALLEAADGLQQDSKAYFKTATTLFGDDNTRYYAYASMLQLAAHRTRKRANQYKENQS